MTGFVPDADVHVLKVGYDATDGLAQALDYCVAQLIDVAYLDHSIGSNQSTEEQSGAKEIIASAISRAVQSGVVMLVGSGNEGAGLCELAANPNTVAVGALGKLSETPLNTFAATQVTHSKTSADGTFVPDYSGHGPELTVAGPGVSIISTTPNSEYVVEHSTVLAAAHVAGLIGLTMAHHQPFRDRNIDRSIQRVGAAIAMAKGAATPFNLGSNLEGSGMPTLGNLLHAFA